MRQQHRLAGALDMERLLGVERRGTRVRTGQHGERVGRQVDATTPTAATGCRRSSAESRWSRADASQRCRQLLDDQSDRSSPIRKQLRRGRCGAPPIPRARAASDHRCARYRARHRRTSASVGAADVAQSHERVATYPPRIAIRDVPPTPPLQDLGVGRVEQLDQRDPRLEARFRGRMLCRESNRWRAHRLAVVAAVDAIADRGTPLSIHHAGLLDDPRQAPAGVDDPGAMIAPVGQASRQRRHDPQPSGFGAARRRQRGGGDDAAEHEPTAGARARRSSIVMAQTGVLKGLADVRFGSLADKCSAKRHVRSSPESGHDDKSRAISLDRRRLQAGFGLPITRAANDRYPLRVEMAPSGMMIVQPFSPDIIDLALSSAS